LLLRRWSRAKIGEGQVVLLTGEAGIGKSRLTAALLERLVAEPHTRLRYFCSPQHTDSALFPIIAQMQRAARLAHDDTPGARLDRLGPAKEVAQIGGAIGREFSHALLAAVVRKPEVELASALDRLITAGLLFRQGVPPYRRICSSMPWCKTRPTTARCCASGDVRCPPASRKRSNANSQRSPRTSPNC
jgi:predicted ATPase